MPQNCKNCSTPFEVEESDKAFYERVSPTIGGQKYLISPPTHCPYCRLQRRLSLRNERGLYKRTCGLCKESIISMYTEDKPYPVYCQECWWGDKWDGAQFFQEIDFAKPFFQQFQELQSKVPRLALLNKAPENSEYCNYAGYNKNCYMAVGGSWYNEDCLHGRYYDHCKSSCDCSYLMGSELCYEIMWGENLYGCAFCIDCFDSNDCFFSQNLRGCKNCLFCSNLRNKEYHVHNKPVSKEEFATMRADLKSYSKLMKALEAFCTWRETTVNPATLQTNCENSMGDYLRNCKNVIHGFMISHGEDGKYVFGTEYYKDFMDCSMAGFDNPELFYECVNAGNGGQSNAFCFNNWTCNDVYYCDTPQSSNHCFGCVSVHHKEYCILNKQYTQEDYEKLVPQLIAHMQKTGEWGEFFPIAISPFAYNETSAAEELPMPKEEVVKRGWTWKEEQEEPPKADKVIPADKLPDSIDDIPGDVCNWAIVCSATKKPFKITKTELAFLRQMELPVPRLHPDERHRRRMKLRRPYRFYKRTCAKCNQETTTTYSSERKETVYCEKCYLAEVH